MYELLLFLHLVGVVGFASGHGVSAIVTIRLPREREESRLQTLLDLSRSTLLLSNLSLLLIVVSGISLWLRFDYQPQGWLWASVGVLVVLAAGGFGLAAPYFRRIRSALSAGDLGALGGLLASRMPWTVFALETSGTLFIVWLMVFKPF